MLKLFRPFRLSRFDFKEEQVWNYLITCFGEKDTMDDITIIHAEIKGEAGEYTKEKKKELFKQVIKKRV